MKTLLIIFFLITSNILTAQVTQEWLASYTGTGTGGNYADKNATDKFGNLIVAGRTSSNSTDYLILKYNSSGNLLWSQSYNGIDNSTDWLSDLILDDSGNVYITGSSKEGAANGYYNWLTIKYSPDGELRWKKNLDWTMHKEDIAYSITLDNDRNILVAGYGWALPEGYQNFDIVVAKYNNNGEVLWTRSFGSTAYHSDWGYSVVTDDSGCAYVSGYSYENKIVTIKYDENGNNLWEKEYPRMNGEYVYPLYSKIDMQNNIIVNGYYQVSGQSNFVTLKYDRNGNLKWDRVFDNPDGESDYSHSIYTDENSNIYIAGSTQITANYYDFLFLKYSPNGDTLLKKTYDNGIGESDIANSLVVDSFENVYLTGSTYSVINNSDFLTIKYNALGDLIWIKEYSIPNGNISNSICMDYDNNVYISGYSVLSSNFSVAISIKYSQLTNIDVVYSPEKDKLILYNYPNPFNQQTSIFYILKETGFVKLVIFDIRGRTITELNNQKQLSGNYKIDLDCKFLNSGIYFCKLIINNKYSDTVKMLLLK